jgi:putative transposase
MSRPLRLKFPGALYHVTSRGDRREPIFDDDVDRSMFLAVLEQGVERFNVAVFAYCLMGNHFHLVLETREANLSRLMRHLNGVYTQRYNRRHDKIGHLFQGRFKAILIDADNYFLEVCRYVDLNPVRAALVKRPGDWRWSSYRAHTGRVASPIWLESALLHRQLAPRAPRREGPQRYASFVAEGRGMKLWDEALSGQIYLGGEAFVKRMQAKIGRVSSTEIPRVQRRTPGRSLEAYLSGTERNEAIAEAYLEGGYTQSAIARAMGLSVSRISRVIAGVEAKGKT